MVKHESKICPRCGTLFECKVGSIALCQCNGISLSDEERKHLNETFKDCLCASCIKESTREYNIGKFTARIKKLLGVYERP